MQFGLLVRLVRPYSSPNSVGGMAKRPIENNIDEAEEESPRAKRGSRRATNAQLESLYDESSARILQERNDFFLSIPSSPKVILNANTFSLFLGSPSPDGVKEALERIGMKFDWDDLGRIDHVQAALKSKGVRETSKQIVQFLTEAARRRNSIVHRASAQEQIGENDVSRLVQVLIAITTGLLQLAKADYEKKCR
jgi:hypothetical protein